MKAPAALITAAILGLVGATLRANPVTLLSADRHVNTSAFAGASNGSMTDSQAQTATLFADFHGAATATAIWPDPLAPGFRSYASASASQNSTFGALGFTMSQAISFNAGTPLPGGGMVQAIALSFFQVTFVASEATHFKVTYEQQPWLNPLAHYSDLFNLHSDSSDLNFEAPPYGTVFGDLVPGKTYTFTAWQRFEYATPDPLGQAGIANSAVTVSFSVPESGGFWCLLVALFALAVFKGITRFQERQRP